MQWPQRMPREGLLEVDFRTAHLVADTRVPVLDEQFDNLYRPTLAADADVNDAFRATFCQVSYPCASAPAHGLPPAPRPQACAEIPRMAAGGPAAARVAPLHAFPLPCLAVHARRVSCVNGRARDWRRRRRHMHCCISPYSTRIAHGAMRSGSASTPPAPGTAQMARSCSASTVPRSCRGVIQDTPGSAPVAR